MRHVRLVFLALFVAVAVHPPVTAQGLRFTLFERYLDALRLQGRIPGLSAAIVSGRDIIWERGFGYQDLGALIPATPNTPYLIGDISQVFGSLLLMQCMESGTVRLDDPLNQWTEEATPTGITLRRVLAHVSGTTLPAVFRYNSPQYTALTSVITACNNQSYPLVLAEKIFDRLAMFDSVPGRVGAEAGGLTAKLFNPKKVIQYRSVLERVARPYRIDIRGRAILSKHLDPGVNSSIGIVSTVRDLAKFGSALDDDVLLFPETRELVWANAFSQGGKSVPTGLGWFVQNYYGQHIVWHFGLMPNAFSSLMIKVPDRDLTLIVLANSDGLNSSFGLSEGNVTSSLFARLFLRLFVRSGPLRGDLGSLLEN